MSEAYTPSGEILAINQEFLPFGDTGEPAVAHMLEIPGSPDIVFEAAATGQKPDIRTALIDPVNPSQGYHFDERDEEPEHRAAKLKQVYHQSRRQKRRQSTGDYLTFTLSPVDDAAYQIPDSFEERLATHFKDAPPAAVAVLVASEAHRRYVAQYLEMRERLSITQFSLWIDGMEFTTDTRHQYSDPFAPLIIEAFRPAGTEVAGSEEVLPGNRISSAGLDLAQIVACLRPDGHGRRWDHRPNFVMPSPDTDLVLT